jgi:hypothetical protein
MNGISGWFGSGGAVIVMGLCWLAMKHMEHLPAKTHPYLRRAVIAAMYCAGAALAVTSAGEFVIRLGDDAEGLAGGARPGTGLAWALVTTGALLLAAAVVVALIWVPDLAFAYVAAAAPLVLALAPGGFAHSIYTATAGPAQDAVYQIAAWAGG